MGLIDTIFPHNREAWIKLNELHELPVVSREEWSAFPWTSEEPNNHPVRHLRLQYTGGPVCHTREQCYRLLREMQKDHMEKVGLPDIMYNFIIGIDGTIYEARGWNRCAFRADKHDFILRNDMINVAYMGNYKETPLPMKAERACLNLVKFAETKKYLKKESLVYPMTYGNIDFTYF